MSLERLPNGWRCSRHADMVFSAAFSSDGTKLATGDRAGAVLVHDLKTMTTVQELPTTSDDATIYTLLFLNKGSTVASAPWRQSMTIWDLNSSKVAKSLRAGRGPWFLATAKEDLILDVGGIADGEIRLWDTTTWTIRSKYKGDTDNPISAAFAQRHLILAVSDDVGRVFVRQLHPESKLLYQFQVPAGAPVSLACDEAGTHLAVAATDGLVRIIALASGESVAEYNMEKPITALALTADGKTLAVATLESHSQSGVRVCSASTGKEIVSSIHHTGAINMLRFSPGDKFLVSCSSDKSFVLLKANWEQATKK